MKLLTFNSLQRIAILIAAIPAAVAAPPSPACAPILAAMAKTLQVDHTTVTQSDGRTTNGITAGGVNYLQIGDAWQVSRLSPQDNQARSDKNLRNAKAYKCQTLPDGIVDGVTVANYRTRTETEDTVVESTISISKTSGLAVKVDNDIAAGESDKSHLSTHYSYTAVRAPSIKN